MSRRALILAAAALGLAGCFGGPAPEPAPEPAPVPAPSPPPPSPPSGVACQDIQTLSFESEAPNATTYEAIVDSDAGGSVYVSFEAASQDEFFEQIAEIEATVGPVTEVGEQVEVGLLEVNPNNDPRYGSSGPQKLALDQAKFREAWSKDEDGAGIIVAVVDTGVQGGHVDLAGNLLPGVDFAGSGSGTCVDPNGHGTHVAGIVGQVDNTIGGIGGAPAVKILPVRVLGSDGTGSSPNVAAGIDWAASHGADVINLSLGGPQSDAITDAVNRAVNAGVTVIAAAGNCGGSPPQTGCGGRNAASYPAALPNVIAVGAVNTGQTTRASFSNNNDYVDIAAPGTSIDSTVPDSSYGLKSGTSMATPFVSAVSALVLRDCALSPSLVLAKIQSSATVLVSDFAGPVKLVDADAASTNC